MNSSRHFFTAEELAAVRPWRLPCVGDEVDAVAVNEEESSAVVVTEEEVETAPRLTAEEIEAMQKQAYEEAAAQGRDEGRQQGYREGFEQGRAQGYEQGESELREHVGKLESILTLLDQPLQEVDEQMEQELATLAIAMARQLIRRELRTDPGQIIAVVREALAVLPSSARKVSLFLHPDDAELVRATISLDETGQRWKLVDDPLLTRGGCRVISDNSVIDATVEKRLNAVIARAFGGERGGDPS
ncbi:MAG: flagellar assembly protein fliH/type secretion system HrpE [Proteobacteria bacterium]|nr:flagellar assembly protein fliH/type secretion system HrpE [Pseudomonadota bacterium]